MTQQSVRLAIQNWLKPPTIPGLYQVNRAPTQLVEATSILPNGVSYGATSYVWLESTQERVLATGDPQGGTWRMCDYQAALIFDWIVLQPNVTDDSWMDALDLMVQAIQTRLRSDPTLGTTGSACLTVFSAANEFPDTTTPSITVFYDEPATIEDTQAMLIHGGVAFPVHDIPYPGT